MVRPPILLALFLFMGAGLVACAPLPEAEGERAAQQPNAPQFQPELAEPDENVRTVQLYEGDDERQPPVLQLSRGSQLTLSFDLLERSGRPLSIHFYHANRRWQKDLVPSEYMTSFQNANLLDYQPSRGTDVDYVHYRYRFPNDQIDFRVSGNYILRVSEQGNENAILFEKAFFVTEGAGTVGLDIERVLVGGQQRPSLRPVVRYRPQAEELSSAQDYSVCVMRNARFGDVRCSDRARLAAHPTMMFEVERENAFPPLRPSYKLDLSRLQGGGQIEGIDRERRPVRVLLEPDYPQFPRRTMDAPLYGPVVQGAAQGFGDASVEAEYVTVRFSLQPRERRPQQQPLYLVGTFGPTPDHPLERLEWNDARERYEAEALIKQGLYEYRYTNGASVLQEIGEGTEPVPARFLSLIYYRDVRLNTDRLVAAESVVHRFN